MVIFGAGASYDSDPVRPPGGTLIAYRLPLASELFLERFGDVADDHEGCAGIIPRLRRAGIEVEQELQKITVEAQKYPHFNRPLMSLRYYLKNVIQKCESGWISSFHPATNYIDLIERLARWQVDFSQKIAFVTFNYDTLLDVAYQKFFGVELNSMEAYVANKDWRIFKVHGSTNWLRRINSTHDTIGTATGLVDERTILSLLSSIEMTNSYTTAQMAAASPVQGITFVPAIAIPTIQKSGFECPPSHIEVLQSGIGEVDRLLVVGWRGMEEHFLSLWKSSGPFPRTKVLIVTASQEGADKTAGHLKTGAEIKTQVRTESSVHGFSTFLQDPQESHHLEWLLS